MSERRTETHVYFFGGLLSQWAICSFVASPFPGFPSDTFNCAEQYMMASKALLFQDGASYEAIMQERSPKLQKAIGRKVRDFDAALWNCCAQELVYRGNLAKFSQNPELRDHLLSTGDRFIVEGSPYDGVWGVKLSWDDPRIEDRGNWRGTNWLGEVLMRTREALR